MTPVVNDFSWRSTTAGHTLSSAQLSGYAAHCFSGRDLSFRELTQADDYRRLGHLFDVPPEAIVRVTQVHGRGILVIARDHPENPEALDQPPPADAIVSFRPGVVIAVHVADCVPILIADRTGRAVAAIHAGWRGTAVGVTSATVECLRNFDIDPRELVAAVGPSIGPCCYQVDEPVRDAFIAEGKHTDALIEDGPGHWKLDLRRANVDQLVNAGVPATAIAVAGCCTADTLARCFSYRREGAGTGRMAAAIRL